MKNANPLVERFQKLAKVYLEGALTLHEIKNRNPDYWIVCYYLLSHSLELAIKANLTSIIMGHDLKKLIEIYEMSNEKLTDDEKLNISKLSRLNKETGGLRYDDQTEGRFLPSTFESISNLVKSLIIR